VTGVPSARLEGASSTPYWLDQAQRPGPREAHAGDVDVDLLVVGGGFTGLWAAVLALEEQPGRDVLVLEGHRLGWAASGRNGGFCSASLTHGQANGETRWPNDIDRLNAMGLENLDGMQDEIGRLGLDVEWQRSGMLAVATEPHQVEWLRDEAESGHGRFLDRRQFYDHHEQFCHHELHRHRDRRQCPLHHQYRRHL